MPESVSLNDVLAKGPLPRLSDPLEIGEDLRHELPPLPGDPGAPQPWSGYDPPCDPACADRCGSYPAERSNIKPGRMYDGVGLGSDRWIRLACDVARQSVGMKGGPFGAVLLQVDDETNRVVRYWVNHNQVTLANDPTAHAEVMAIRSACASLGVFNLGEIRQRSSKLDQPGELSHGILYSSTEPCPMCYAAIRWARIPLLLFAATRYDAGVDGVDFSDREVYEDLARPYIERGMAVYQCTADNSLDAFNLWKRSVKIPY